MFHRSAIRMQNLPLTFSMLLALLVGSWGSLAQAEPAGVLDQVEAKAPALGKKWVRIARDPKNKPLALEVAIVRYVPTGSAKGQAGTPRQYVDLIGAVHIGDRGYYRQLNRRFESYDALLFELVAPQGTVVPKGRGTSNTHPLGAMQNAMGTMLEVEHQLEQIDYTRPNFVHADLSPEEFARSMQNRDESFLKMYFRLMGQAIAQQSQQAAEGESLDLDIMAAFLSDDRPRKLKIALAKQFEKMETLMVGLSGPDGSTLITERNKRALEVLRKQQAAGVQRIGIFYGAGHLSDMHDRLTSEFDMVPLEITWLEAWNLRKKK